MTPNEITTSLAEKLKRELDFTLKRSLMFTVNTWRGTIIKQTIQATPADRRLFTQALYVDMTPHSTVEGIDICQHMSVSTTKIPRVLRTNGTQYDYVGSIDGYTAFGTFTFGTERYLRSSYANAAGIPSANVENQKLYVTDDRIKLVKLVGIADDPEQWFNYNCKTGGCDYWNSEYPAPTETLQRIIQSIIMIEFRGRIPGQTQELEVNAEEK